MTVRHLYIFLVFITYCFPAFPQDASPVVYTLENESPHDQCAHTEIHERLMLENSSYKAEQEAREATLAALVEQLELGFIAKSDEIYTVPVVVHIIHEGEAYGVGTNITDEQIYSAINGLNEDFRKLPGTLGDGEGADIGVEFCLAQRDPDGNAHNGINRVNGCSVADYCEEGITAGQGEGANEMSVKNLSRWPNQQYYNIWVVNEIENNNGGSGIQGYAYFPTTSQVDGTVLLFNAFGTTGNLKSYTNKNRTVTHELGHAFALFHTFQGGSCTEANCASQGDRVCDTPPTVLNSNCGNPACGGTQQVNNYMDYTSQNCKNMFSFGQKDRMRLAINNSRTNLINSNGCEPVVFAPADGAITSINYPEGNTCESVIQPIIELSNEGPIPIANAQIEYRTTGPWQMHNWTGMLGQNQQTTIVLPDYDGGWGPQNFQVRLASINGGGDSNPSNDLLTKTYEAVNDGHELTLAITLDLLGSQTTWLIRDDNNVTIASGGPYGNFQNGSVNEYSICVVDGCYELLVLDANGDGMCCGNGNGSFLLTEEDGTVLASGGSFGSSDITGFCLNDGDPPPSAQFEASETTICVGESITFTDLTTGDVDSYDWKFFGGAPFTVTTANPGTIAYDTPGTYDVRLAATNAFGTDVELKAGYITVLAETTWYADNDGDGYGDMANTSSSCDQPAGYVDNSDDCDDNNINDWDSCYDCAGVMNGSAQLDNCGVCDTNTSNDCAQDCAGTWGGTAYTDNCGVCDSNPANDCTQDCAGTWGGAALEDNCGVCDTNPANDCTQDCAGTWGGSAYEDNCGVCDTNPSNDCVQDCAGTWGGNAYEDNCGVCDANPTNDCVQDCAGTWGGAAYFDSCGVCDEDPDNDCIDCEELNISVASQTAPSCFGAADGSISIDIESVGNDYAILWNTGATTASITGLNAGTYQVTVTEETCTDFLQITLGQPDVLNVVITDIIPTDCEGNPTGSATAAISGGTPPYTINLNGIVTPGAIFSELAEDTYTVQVSDLNGCTTAGTFSIGSIPCDSLDATTLNTPYCENLNISFFEIVSCAQVSGAQGYEWSFEPTQGGADSFTYNTTTHSFTPADIPQLIPMASYTIAVRATHASLPSIIGAECNAAFVFGTAQLVSEDCNRLDFAYSESISCTEIIGAENYEFRFEDVISMERFTHYTSGALETQLSEVEGLQAGREYAVAVRVQYRGVWGGYGQNCALLIDPQTITTRVVSGSCENYSIDTEIDVIFVEPIPNATVYELRISGGDLESPLRIQNNQLGFDAANFEELTKDLIYLADARAFNGETWTPWGAQCEIGFKGLDNFKLNMHIYPNPVLSGQTFEIMMKGDWNNVQFRMYDLTGYQIFETNENIIHEIPHTVSTPDLPAGIYMINAIHGFETLTKKIIIQ